MGFPVIPNPYLPAPAAGATSLYLANWPRFLQIVDDNEMVIKMFEETQAGFVTIYAEKRIVSTVRDVFAGIGLAGV
jgi:HK97 family phage major capsid protein